MKWLVCLIDLIILDLSIPGSGIDGVETAQQLLAMNPDVKLVVSSGDSYGEIMKNYRHHGFSGALEKNFDRAEIQRVLDEVLSVKS